MHEHHQAALECEGELSSGLAEEAIALATRLFDDAGSRVRRIVDLGCGPGVGTVILAKAFSGATVVAVDSSPAMLERVAARSAQLVPGARIETRPFDLNDDLQALGRFDLAWAAMSIHHVRDEVATLQSLRALVAPHGLLCILERAEPLFVRSADELGRAGVWDRLGHARRRWFEHTRDRLPGAMKAETYPSMLTTAGLDILIDRPLARIVAVPRDPAMHEFIAGVLRRSLTELAAFAAADDLAALSRFLDQKPASPDRFEAMEVTTSRKLFIARSAA